MYAVRKAGRTLLNLLAVLGVAVSLAVAGGAAPATASTTGGGTSGCDPYVDGTLILVPCSSGSDASGSVGSGGAGGSAASISCRTVVLDQATALSLGLSWPPPNGKSWGLLDCLGGVLGPLAVLVSSASAAPAVTPQQLLVTALGELHLPSIAPDTAPPRGHDALVGLPEWFWVPAARWHARTVTVSVGPVWATVTAAPMSLTFAPGTGLSPVSCPGPGAAYDQRTTNGQQTNCSYTYLAPSTGQPGNAYQASVTVDWRVSWTGSGGAGGVLDAALAIPVAFTVPVAQGEALVTSP
jgi:hypothetical protein